jgi:hypothetical protein
MRAASRLSFRILGSSALLASWGCISVIYLFGLENIPASSCVRDHLTETLASSSTLDDNLLVEYGDYIYKVGEWDGSPVVIEDYNLIFFTTAKVGCTGWKQLFRRMMGIKDWQIENVNLLPWNSELNGLRHLYDYDRETASHMMTAPDWTRAVIVREPKERFLSAYLDKAFHESFLRRQCCPSTSKCVKPARKSPEGFLKLIQKCDNSHWRPQSSRMENKYWRYVNFVGHMDTMEEDAKRLLKSIGAWDQYGASGWGEDGGQSIFQSKTGGRMHATDARDKLRSYISPKLEQELKNFYRKDYQSPFLGVAELKIH